MIPENAPQWLKDADTKNAVVEIEIRFGVTWVIWKGGEFRGGYFLGGEFRGGEFRGGYFLGGYFLGGYFLGGEFRGGYFLGGYFLGGEFRGGYFLGGEFRGGEFRGGFIAPNCKYFIGIGIDWSIKIGCKEKTIEEWDKWFKSKEVFNTERGTPAFNKIYANYRSVREYCLIMMKTDKKPI